MWKKYWGFGLCKSPYIKMCGGLWKDVIFTAPNDLYLDEEKIKSEKWIYFSVSNSDYISTKFKYGSIFIDISELTAGFKIKV